jgi:predicted ATPase/class 3 adenylate cyclase
MIVQPMTEIPTGTVTFLFTDVEGSTKLWERNPEAMSRALSRHDELVRNTVETHGGFVFKTVGDAFYVAFSTATEAVAAALDVQRVLLSEEWEETGPLRVRMALHTGEAEERGRDYFGPTLNRVARLLSAAHGGQLLLSLSTKESVGDRLPPGARLRDLGQRRLKDLTGPELVFQIATPDTLSSFPPLKTLDARLNNLPTQPTPFIGREREVAEISDLLRRAEVRLLTLTGTGGTGKTRLGLQSAADLIDEFEDGVFFVALAPVSDPELVAPTVAGALSVSESAERALIDTLENELSNKELLLVLDNFEQVLDAVSLVGELLSSCPGLKVLVTSRTLLRVYGEYEYPVRSLELPDPRRLPPIATLRRYEAIRLFVERARVARADFYLTTENAPAVAEICARLDGLPLAIELAAARMKLFSPQAICSRLGDPLKFLTGGARNLPERQRTLRGAIAWSHALLSESEQILFARLAVFSGGCYLEAVEAICAVEDDYSVDILEVLSSFLDKSLLRREEVEEEPRISMLETLREYARERLEASGEAEKTRRLHAEYFLGLAEEDAPDLRGSEEAKWIERLETEHDNMRAALSWTLQAEETELGLQLAGALWQFWDMRGYYTEGRRWLEEALARDGGAPETRARVLEGVGWLADVQGDIDRAVAAAEEGLRLSAQTRAQTNTRASFLRILGSAAYVRGDHRQAARLYEESLALSRRASDERGVASSLHQLGNVSSDRGDYEEAKKYYEEGLALSRELGDTALLASTLISVGAEFLLQGDHERGARLNQEAAELLREQGSRGHLQYALDNLGWAALMRGDPQRAVSLHQESLALSRQLGDKLVAAEAMEGLACWASTRGESERVARLFGAAEALRESVGYRQEPREQTLRVPYLAAARARSAAFAWDVAWAEGRRLGFDEAISYALEEAGI